MHQLVELYLLGISVMLTYEVIHRCSVLKQPCHSYMDHSDIERKLNITAKLAMKCKIHITGSSLVNLQFYFVAQCCRFKPLGLQKTHIYMDQSEIKRK